jgi:hypothetical protein
MRRVLLALTAGILVVTTGCGTARTPAPSGTTGAPPAPAAPAPGGASGAAPAATATTTGETALASTRALCEGLGQVYTKNMGSFAEALSKMVADGEKSRDASREKAQQALTAFATAIRDTTASSTIGDARADGKRTADLMQAKAADDKFFDQVKTSKDLDRVLGPDLKKWLAPVDSHCS